MARLLLREGVPAPVGPASPHGRSAGSPRPENGALYSILAEYVMYAVGITPVADLIAPTEAQVQAVKDALAPWASRQMYLELRRNTTRPGNALDRAGLLPAALHQGRS